MNGLGVTLVIIALILFTAKWVYTWRAGRRVMRKTRQRNARNSITSLVDSWKRKRKQWLARE